MEREGEGREGERETKRKKDRERERVREMRRERLREAGVRSGRRSFGRAGGRELERERRRGRDILTSGSLSSTTELSTSSASIIVRSPWSNLVQYSSWSNNKQNIVRDTTLIRLIYGGLEYNSSVWCW